MNSKTGHRLLGNRRPNKLPLFVTVYEKLYDDIISGKYKPGDQLPSENALAKQMKVSRGTLRQALLFLQEDRMIVNRQGIGNFVLDISEHHLRGIETLNHSLMNHCHYPIDDIKFELLFQAANKKQKAELQLPTSSLVAFLEAYHYVANDIVALAMIFIPYGLLETNEVDLEEAENIHSFYLQLLEGMGATSNTELQVVTARKSTANKMKIKEKDPILMVEETIFFDNVPSIINKTYFRPDYFRFTMRRKNDRF